MLRTASLLPLLQGFRHWASTPDVSLRRCQPATGPPDSYPDRTHTGRRRRAYEHEDQLPNFTASPLALPDALQTVHNKSATAQAAERDIDTLRAELRKARDENRRLIQLNQTYAAIINQLFEDLDTVTSERNALQLAPRIPRIPRRMEKRNAPA
jgi:uncharacterized protein YhaN